LKKEHKANHYRFQMKHYFIITSYM